MNIQLLFTKLGIFLSLKHFRRARARMELTPAQAIFAL